MSQAAKADTMPAARAEEANYVLLVTREIEGKLRVLLTSRPDDFLTHEEALRMRSRMMRPATIMLAKGDDQHGRAAIAAHLAFIAGDAPNGWAVAA